MSVRSLESRRERLAFETQFQTEQRNTEDREQYDKYVAQLRAENLEPLSFDEWRKFAPADESNPALRGAIATANSNVNRTVLTMRDRVASQPLDDETLKEFGFDVEDRVLVEEDLSPYTVRLALKEFVRCEKRWDTSSHFEALSQFMQRNKLYPTIQNFSRAFCLLWNLGIIRPKPPKPEPSQLIQPKNSGLNERGVNLRIEPDSAIEKRKQWEKYTTEVVATDPRNGRTWTQYQLDHEADAETFRRLVFGDHAIPRVTDVITEG